MDVTTLMHSLRQEITCSVCIHLFKEPKQLPCLHIFCLECLNGLATTNAPLGKIKCPLCQIEVAVPDCGTMESLPDCFYLKNLLDVLAIKECNTSKVTCGNCDKKSAEASYCFRCCKFWCKECLRAHNILREYREHRVLALKDFQDEDFEDVVKRPAFCPKELHERGVFKFFCKECEVPACQTCVTLEHGKHDVEHLEITARTVKDNIASKLEAAKKSSSAISNYVRKLEEQSHRLESHSQTIKRNIKEKFKTLIQTLKQKERELITEEEIKANEAKEKLMEDKAKLQAQLKEIDETVSQITCLLGRSTGAELVKTKASLEELLHALPEVQEMLFDEEILKRIFVVNQEVSHRLLQDKLGHFGETSTVANQSSVEGQFQDVKAGLEAHCDVITRNSEGEQFYCTGDYISVDITTVDGGKAAVITSITDRSDGSYEVIFIPGGTGEHSAAARVNGEDVKESLSFDVHERTFKSVKSIGEQTWTDDENLDHPWGVTVNNSNEIVVSDLFNKRIVVLSEEGQFVRSFGQNLPIDPKGMSIDNEGRIYVANSGKGEVLLFDSNGKFVEVFVEQELLNEPRGICFDSQGNLIVCDSGNKRIRFYSQDGNNFRTIGMGWLQMPYDCLFHEEKIFVSDYDANLVKVYSKDGRYLYDVGKYGTGNSALKHPTGLAVDKTNHLLICCAGSHNVKVFTLDGKFVTSFGEEGEQLGQLGRPTSVVILKSGHILVCELENNRLQVFA